MSLRKYLDRLSDVPPDLAPSVRDERFIADFGEEFAGSRRPPGIRLRAPKKCFVNAAVLVWDHEDHHDGDLTYVEGFARDMDGFHFLHAWCVRGNLVVDPTLRHPEDHDYLGIRISTLQMAPFLAKQGHYGILSGSCRDEFVANWMNTHSPVLCPSEPNLLERTSLRVRRL